MFVESSYLVDPFRREPCAPHGGVSLRTHPGERDLIDLRHVALHAVRPPEVVEGRPDVIRTEETDYKKEERKKEWKEERKHETEKEEGELPECKYGYCV